MSIFQPATSISLSTGKRDEKETKWDGGMMCRTCKHRVRPENYNEPLRVCIRCEESKCLKCRGKLSDSGVCFNCTDAFRAMLANVSFESSLNKGIELETDIVTGYVGGVKEDKHTTKQLRGARDWEQAEIDSRERSFLDGVIHGTRTRIKYCRHCYVALPVAEQQDGQHSEC